jgi:hypothetical protein
VRLLVWPSTLSLSYSPPYLPIVHAISAEVLPGIVILVTLIAVAVYAVRRAPLVTFVITWMAISLAPVSNVFFVSGVFVAERTLFMPSVGFALAVGALVGALWARMRADAARDAAIGLFATVLIAAAARSALRQRAWADNAHILTAAARVLPNAYTVDALYGEFLATQGATGSAERWLLRAIALYPSDPEIHVELANLYTAANRWPAAQSLFSQALAIDSTLPSARAGLVLCLVHAHDYRNARAQAELGIQSGLSVETFRELVTAIDAAERGGDSMTTPRQGRPH